METGKTIYVLVRTIKNNVESLIPFDGPYDTEKEAMMAIAHYLTFEENEGLDFTPVGIPSDREEVHKAIERIIRQRKSGE